MRKVLIVILFTLIGFYITNTNLNAQASPTFSTTNIYLGTFPYMVINSGSTNCMYKSTSMVKPGDQVLAIRIVPVDPEDEFYGNLVIQSDVISFDNPQIRFCIVSHDISTITLGPITATATVGQLN
jgi:hypothetical protein